jgi:predicted flap endonuclease-1-like 5' DNA nuclease
MPADAEGDGRGGLPRGIGRPATAALALVGVTRLEQAAAMTDRELLALHGVGPKAVRLLRETIAEGRRPR